MNRRQAGFAVVLAVALLAAIVLLLVALAALTRTELRAAAQRGAAVQARQQALAGLRVALGRLQAAAGPDACSTATAERLGARQRHWTGVWRDAGEPVWLVSGAPANADVAITTDGSGGLAGALLVGPGSTPAAEDAVLAPYESIDTTTAPGLEGERSLGRFAYWIADEGVKAHVGLIDEVEAVPVAPWSTADDPVTTAAERTRLRQLCAHRSGNDALNFPGPPPGGFQLAAEDSAAAAARWEAFGAALTFNHLRFQSLGTPQADENFRAFVRRGFHRFTVVSAGVLADAAHGGLRRNLSALGAAEVPAAVRDLERYRPVAGRLPIAAGTADAGEAAAQIKPVVTEWALDFVPFRAASGSLVLGCRLRLELWNPFHLPLALTPAGVTDFRVRVGGRRTSAAPGDTGLPVVEFTGPAGEIGAVDLRALLGPDREIAVDASGDLAAGAVRVVEAFVETAWDTGFAVVDPTPADPTDNVLRCSATDDGGRVLRIEVWNTDSILAPLTVLDGFPSGAFARTSVGDWSEAGGAPFAGEAWTRLGVSYHFRLAPERANWADWVEPGGALPPGPNLKSPRIDYAASFWRSVGGDPAANATAGTGQFASDELFAAGDCFAAYDFTVQRNLSIAALGQLSVPGERPFCIGQPWGGARNQVFDEAMFNPVPATWRPGDPLPHVRHRVGATPDRPAPEVGEVGGPGAAAFLLGRGLFNVNSLTPEAWTVALGRAILGWTDATGTSYDLENPFFTFGQSAPYAPAGERGVRTFPDGAIQELAGAVAARVAARPRPFRSLAEFVNSGVLQSAIEAAGLNTREEYCRDLAGGPPARWTPSFLTQAGILNTLAPSLAVRSDTFTIRVAAEALNPALAADAPGRVTARAWCEAVVQRGPEFVDASEAATTWPPTRSVNQTLGRRFRIVGFRWLGPDDL